VRNGARRGAGQLRRQAWSLTGGAAIKTTTLADGTTGTGWHIMQVTYVAGGTKSEFQIYDFGVDPRMRW
jgi:hypothetical protein